MVTNQKHVFFPFFYLMHVRSGGSIPSLGEGRKEKSSGIPSLNEKGRGEDRSGEIDIFFKLSTVETLNFS